MSQHHKTDCLFLWFLWIKKKIFLQLNKKNKNFFRFFFFCFFLFVFQKMAQLDDISSNDISSSLIFFGFGSSALTSSSSSSLSLFRRLRVVDESLETSFSTESFSKKFDSSSTNVSSIFSSLTTMNGMSPRQWVISAASENRSLPFSLQ